LKTKVLFVVEQLEDSRYYLDLFGHLESQNFEVWFYNLANFKFNPDVLGERTILNKSSRYYLSIFNLNSISNKFDIIHAHETIPAFYSVVASIASIKKKNIVFHWHHGKSIGLKQLIMDSIAKLGSNKVIFVSNEMLSQNIGKNARNSRKYGVIENGISVDYSGLKPNRDIDICLLGRLREEKGFLFILEVIKEIRKNCGSLNVKLIGDGPLRSRIEDKIDELELSDCVELLGYLYDPIPYLTHSKLVIVPSYSEPFGIVAIEAMGAGATLIASNVGGLKQIIEHNKNGVLVEKGDHSEFCNSISLLLQDTELRNILAIEGRKTFEEKYSAKKMANRYIGLYQELI